MEPEGMVHALEEIHRILKPTGTLIEIHPAVDSPPVVEVRSAGTVTFSESDPGFDYLDDLRRAEEAVATALDRGVFVIHERRPFELRTHAASVEELRDHWTVYGATTRRRRIPGSPNAKTGCTAEPTKRSDGGRARSSSTSSPRPCRG
jgi:SAM-dependent methyltransferase